MEITKRRLKLAATLAVAALTSVAGAHAAVHARSAGVFTAAPVRLDAHNDIPERRVTTATYVLTFESTWSVNTHPVGFPSNPHFSGLIGGTHNASASFWQQGATASDGIESMAESGGKTLLQNEVEAAVTAGTAQFVISGGGITVSPGSVSVSFDVTSEYPLVTVVSMLAPSPDWFVGVSGMDLMDGGQWTQQVVVPLVVHDAGTDSGTSYTSDNDDTDPPGLIAPLTEAPFDSDNVVGTFTFLLQSVVLNEPTPEAGYGFAISAAYPNPASDAFGLNVTVERDQHVIARLYDIAGRVVRIEDAVWVNAHQPMHLRITASGLAGQTYFLRVTGADFDALRPVTLSR